MNKEVLKILELCLKAKNKDIDCFFDYSPHVEKIEVRIFFKGWEKDTCPNAAMIHYLSKEHEDINLYKHISDFIAILAYCINES